MNSWLALNCVIFLFYKPLNHNCVLCVCMACLACILFARNIYPKLSADRVFTWIRYYNQKGSWKLAISLRILDVCLWCELLGVGSVELHSICLVHIYVPNYPNGLIASC